MSNWSSYKGQKLLAEGWRSYLKGDLYSGEKIEELFGMGKKKKPQVRGTVYNNILAEVTAWMGQTIQSMRKDPELPEEARKIVQEIDEVAIIDEFEEMITGQQFELLEQLPPQAGAFQRDDHEGGIAQTGHVRDPEAEEGEDLPLTFEPDGHENITKFIEVVKDNPEHVEKFVTELKRAGFSNCVDTLGCKKPAVEPAQGGAIRRFRGAGTVNIGGQGADTSIKGFGTPQLTKQKEPEKITTQQGTTAIMLRPDGAIVATDTDGDGKIDDVTPMVERVMELLRQLCAYEVYPEDQRDQAMEQLEDEVRPALEAAGTNELGQLIKELEEEIAQQGECVVPAQITDPHGDAKQLQGPDEILIDYQDSFNRAMEMARTGGIEDFEKDDFDLIYMAMADCNDESYVKFGEPSESSPMARGKWVNEAVVGPKCKDLKELGASPQFIHLVAKAISDVTDGIEYKEFFFDLPGAEIDDDGGGKGEDDGQGGGEDDDQGKKKGEDDDQGGSKHRTPTGFENQTFQYKKGKDTKEMSVKDMMRDLRGSHGQRYPENSFDEDWQEFVDKLGEMKRLLGGDEELQEGNFTVAKMANAFGRDNADRAKALLYKLDREGEGTGAHRMLQALKAGGKARDARVGVPFLMTVLQSVTKGAPAKKKPSDEPQQAAESLLRESTIDRWQQLAGIKKRV